MSEFKNYRKKAVTPMRPYVPGEDLTGVSVAEVDIPEEGGMVARNPEDYNDQWYISKAYFQQNYWEEGSEIG